MHDSRISEDSARFRVFKGVKAGTIVCALINGTLIGLCSKFLEQKFEFTDGLEKLRKYF